MRICIFTGPTISAKDAGQILDAVYLPPAAHGDVYRAASRRPKPQIIGLIDGRFRAVPAVRHKEIMWAMAQGIHVFGAGSIGALRAADLAECGMVGVGEIFAAYRTGAIEDDDEVAVDHGPGEHGYVPVSEAMIDIRATLHRAQRESVIGAELSQVLISLAKTLFYAQRSFPTILDLAKKQGEPASEFEALCAWLPQGRVSKKRQDAVAMLVAIREFLASDPAPLSVPYRFEATEAWLDDMAAATALGGLFDAEGDPVLCSDLLDELKLIPGEYRKAREEALARALALREATRQRIEISEDEIEAATTSWLHGCGPLGMNGALDWHKSNMLDDQALRAFVADEERRRCVTEMAEPLIDRQLLDAIRMRGQLPDLLKRARDKRRRLADAGMLDTTLADTHLSAFDLVAWFIERRLGQPLPPDIEAFAAGLGFGDMAALYRAILREYLYCESCKADVAWTVESD